MMAHDFRHYAELWQEQIDREELAELQAMGKNIEQTAGRKRLIDFSLVLIFIGLAGYVSWTYPASLRARFGFGLIIALMIWAGWKRHQLTRASRATDIHDPHVFFAQAIRNVRAELNMSTLSFYLMVPALIIGLFLMSALRALGIPELIILEVSEKSVAKTTIFAAIWVLAMLYFIRDNIKLRQQLRRLEGMSREWEARDPEEGP